MLLLLLLILCLVFICSLSSFWAIYINMRIIHTSDWHLGHTLKDKTREEEMEGFFSFLRDTIQKERVEVLLISGDIFDTSSPSSAAYSQYYKFLASIKDTCCKEVFVIAGNHDSPSVLTAPKDILDMVNVHVYANKDDIKPFVIKDRLIILPIPFPRDQELRRLVQGESFLEEEDKLRLAIENLYRTETDKTLSISSSLPIVAMGHLMATNAQGEEKRDLYVGGLGAIDSKSFPKELKYVALGHIHKPTSLNDGGTICYSGSPIPFSFKEAKDKKVLKLIDVDGNRLDVRDVSIPVFRKLFSISGNRDEIISELNSLIINKEEGWVSLEIKERGVSSYIRSKAEDMVKDTGLEILVVKDTTVSKALMEKEEEIGSLEDLSEEDIFSLFLDEKEIKGERRENLLSLFREIITGLE